MFIKYPHLERFGTDEVESIELGECYIFPKIDGTNASIWLDENLNVCAGSRNRQLELDNDNAGFYNSVYQNNDIKSLLETNPNLNFYGEWLVPHSLKTYRESAWRQFYVFDVFCRAKDRFLTFDEYLPILAGYDVEVIHPIAIIKNPSYEQLINQTEKNLYLIEDGKGTGEGIVIKNYDYKNKFGRVTWAKIVTNEFKEKHVKEMGGSIMDGKKMIEEEIIESYLTSSFVSKTYEKIKLENDGFNSKRIPELINRVFHDLVNEEIWQSIKKHKNPTINFKTLFALSTREIKKLMPELF